MYGSCNLDPRFRGNDGGYHAKIDSVTVEQQPTVQP